MKPDVRVPIGTHVIIRDDLVDRDGRTICRAGSTGVIVDVPAQADTPYEVRLPEGTRVHALRAQLILRKRHQHEIVLGADDDPATDLYRFVIYRCVIGSRAYGLADDESDTDIRGIYLPPAVLHWSLRGVPEQIENDTTQEAYWELRKFLMMALKANPNILECLYTPLTIDVAPIAEELLEIRDIFLSRFVYQTYNGYVMSQFRKLEQDLRTRGDVRWKHVMHLIRLLLVGITILREGHVPVDVGPHKDALLAIKNAQLPWTDVDAWRLALHQELDDAFDRTSLPERPDYRRADTFLISARASMV